MLILAFKRDASKATPPPSHAVSFIIEQDEPGHPIDVGTLRPFRVVQQAHLRAHLVEQLRQLNTPSVVNPSDFSLYLHHAPVKMHQREEKLNLFRSGDMLFLIR